MLHNLSLRLQELDELGLDPSEYLITGGGVLAIHGIRDCHDLDIFCSEKLGNELIERFPGVPITDFSYCQSMFIGNIEFMFNFKSINRPWSTEQQLSEADIIDGRRFQTLEKLKFFKLRQGGQKQLEDVRLIEEHEIS